MIITATIRTINFLNSLVVLYACEMRVILRNISIKIHFAACFELKHIKVCFHFLNFPLIKFHLRGFHLLQKFSLAHHLQMHTRHIIAIMMVIRRYAKLNKCLWACMNINFFVPSLVMRFGRLPVPTKY